MAKKQSILMFYSMSISNIRDKAYCSSWQLRESSLNFFIRFRHLLQQAYKHQPEYNRNRFVTSLFCLWISYDGLPILYAWIFYLPNSCHSLNSCPLHHPHKVIIFCENVVPMSKWYALTRRVQRNAYNKRTNCRFFVSFENPPKNQKKDLDAIHLQYA